VYNLALVWHVGPVESILADSMVHSSSQLQLLQHQLGKAQGFYNMAMDLIRLLTTIAGSCPTSMAIMASLAGLAITNNRAHIYQTLGRAEDTKACQIHLMGLCSKSEQHLPEGTARMDALLHPTFVGRGYITVPIRGCRLSLPLAFGSCSSKEQIYLVG
jgi:hypothetical protein